MNLASDQVTSQLTITGIHWCCFMVFTLNDIFVEGIIFVEQLF